MLAYFHRLKVFVYYIIKERLQTEPNPNLDNWMVARSTRKRAGRTESKPCHAYGRNPADKSREAICAPEGNRPRCQTRWALKIAWKPIRQQSGVISDNHQKCIVKSGRCLLLLFSTTGADKRVETLACLFPLVAKQPHKEEEHYVELASWRKS